MPKLVVSHPYDGASQRIRRLGLQPLVDEVFQLVSNSRLLVFEAKDSNGGAAIRKMINAQFEKAAGFW